MADLHDMTVAELAAGLKKKDFSAVEVATRFLARMGRDQHNAYLDINSEVTLAQAQASDEKIAKGTAGPLEGVPIAHKDIFVTKDFATTAGSKILKDYRSPFDATVVLKLREAGMVTLGKLNCDEFAMGSANENSAYGAVTNPWDTTRIPGGSSGGSALDPGSHWHGHRWFHPPACCVLRHHRHQAHVWSGIALRHDCFRVELGPSRPHGPQR